MPMASAESCASGWSQKKRDIDGGGGRKDGFMDGPDTTAGGPVPTPFHRMLSSKIVPGSGRGHRPADRQCDRSPSAATACRPLAPDGLCRFRDTLGPFFHKTVNTHPCANIGRASREEKKS